MGREPSSTAGKVSRGERAFWTSAFPNQECPGGTPEVHFPNQESPGGTPAVHFPRQGWHEGTPAMHFPNQGCHGDGH